MEVVPQEIPGIKQISTIMRKFPNALKFYFTLNIPQLFNFF